MKAKIIDRIQFLLINNKSVQQYPFKILNKRYQFFNRGVLFGLDGRDIEIRKLS